MQLMPHNQQICTAKIHFKMYLIPHIQQICTAKIYFKMYLIPHIQQICTTKIHFKMYLIPHFQQICAAKIHFKMDLIPLFSKYAQLKSISRCTVPAKSLGRSYTNSMKRANNSAKNAFCWMICLEVIKILVSGHSLFLNNDFLNLGEYADFPQSP
jgi:hypothetical protein